MSKPARKRDIITDNDRAAREKELIRNPHKKLPTRKDLWKQLDNELDEITDRYIKSIRSQYSHRGPVHKINCEVPIKYLPLTYDEEYGRSTWWRTRLLQWRITKRLRAKTGVACRMRFITSYGFTNIQAEIKFFPAIS